MSDVVEMIARAADVVREKIGNEISTALILGSGLGGLALWRLSEAAFGAVGPD